MQFTVKEKLTFLTKCGLRKGNVQGPDQETKDIGFFYSFTVLSHSCF